MTAVLAIGSHPDDIELGCGGTLARHVPSGDDVYMLVITTGEAGPSIVSARVREQLAAAEILGVPRGRLFRGELPDGRVSNYELDLVHTIERAITQTQAEVVYSHGNLDSHQDNRAVAEATWGAARQARRVLCYDSPSSHSFNPSVFVDITSTVDKKCEALNAHSSQVGNSTMASTSLVMTQAGYRGFQARVEAAEGFMPHRLLLDV
ncbi:PIG-L family deacetylase [Pseudarthrobacter sp. H3Y2-7]|uniref:PIG-L deacetylase family protein n=1 Tax=Pseudarthrobacter naphthalenicus TaxID=3031328 RepID=UPI0023AF4045|nr:PIG-L deacetylase family protein [Pseudarthrobacter sp. H3Y2-7]MDE8667816.1 PIG-L family deacetylase [Pseudarthrobacter sp. H3Y2-7]